MDRFDLPAIGCEQLLQRSRAALRRGQFDLAESLVLEAGDGVWRDAVCLNVLAVIAQARRKWLKARRLWVRSARADRNYQPPRQNLRRYYELFHFGRSAIDVAIGDEPRFLRTDGDDPRTSGPLRRECPRIAK